MNKELIIKEIWEANNKSMIIDYMEKLAHQQAGIEQMQEQAISSPHIVISLKEPLKIVSPTVKVRILSVLVTISGQIKLFQVVTNVKMLKVAIAGMAQGKAIL